MPCDADGRFLHSDAPPPPISSSIGDWTPYRNQQEFELADLLYRRTEMPQGHVDELMNIWAASLQSTDPDAKPPFANHEDLLNTIDATPDGDVPWERFTVSYSGPIPDVDDPPAWMFQEHEICFRDAKNLVANMLSNRDFDKEYDYVARREYDENGDRKYQDLFSADWVWLHSVNQIIFLFHDLLVKERSGRYKVDG